MIDIPLTKKKKWWIRAFVSSAPIWQVGMDFHSSEQHTSEQMKVSLWVGQGNIRTIFLIRNTCTIRDGQAVNGDFVEVPNFLPMNFVVNKLVRYIGLYGTVTQHVDQVVRNLCTLESLDNTRTPSESDFFSTLKRPFNCSKSFTSVFLCLIDFSLSSHLSG